MGKRIWRYWSVGGAIAAVVVLAVSTGSAQAATRHTGSSLSPAPATLTAGQESYLAGLVQQETANESFGGSGSVSVSTSSIPADPSPTATSSNGADAVPLNSGTHCNKTVCENVKSAGGSGPWISYWYIQATQPSDTKVCNPSGYFYAQPPQTLEEIANNPGCRTTNSSTVVVWYAYYPVSDDDPEYFPPGVQLCAAWDPAPPLNGYPCITVGS